jgi:hypothetical protein
MDLKEEEIRERQKGQKANRQRSQQTVASRVQGRDGRRHRVENICSERPICSVLFFRCLPHPRHHAPPFLHIRTDHAATG